MDRRDALSDALFLASLAAHPQPDPPPKADPMLDAKVQEALARLPSIVEHRDSFDEGAPLLKVGYGDELAKRAAKVLERMLGDRGIKSELRTNPWMMDMSQYLFVDVDSLVKAVGGDAK